MKLVVDTHTHSIASGHAYSTIQEMAREAPLNGIETFVITDHGSSMKGSPFMYYFGNLKVIPEKIYGTRIVKGTEANIINYNGKIDIPEIYLKALDFVIAGFHEICIKPSTVSAHTKAVINAMKNPFIDAISHPGNPQFQVDVEKVVLAAKEFNKLIEINNHSFKIRTGSDDNCKNFALLCKEHKVRVTCGSDAHISFDIGKFDNIKKLFDKIDMPKELILNTTSEKFEKYLLERKKRIEKMS